MLEMKVQTTKEMDENSSPNLSIVREVLEAVRNHNKELTIAELLNSNINFNVETLEQITEQVYLNIEFKNPLKTTL